MIQHYVIARQTLASRPLPLSSAGSACHYTDAAMRPNGHKGICINKRAERELNCPHQNVALEQDSHDTTSHLHVVLMCELLIGFLEGLETGDGKLARYT
jgi:hypothetical protein